VRADSLRLLDILDAIQAVEKYAAAGRNRYDADELVRVWVLHHLQIIGEASNNLSAEFKSANPNPVWEQAAAFRNVVVHQYFGIDHELVWNVISGHLDSLKSEVRRIVEGGKP
jgi:uncharacterized protein with HEPN domain